MEDWNLILFYFLVFVSFVCVGTLGYAVINHEWEFVLSSLFLAVVSIVGTVFYKCKI